MLDVISRCAIITEVKIQHYLSNGVLAVTLIPEGDRVCTSVNFFLI